LSPAKNAVRAAALAAGRRAVLRYVREAWLRLTRSRKLEARVVENGERRHQGLRQDPPAPR